MYKIFLIMFFDFGFYGTYDYWVYFFTITAWLHFANKGRALCEKDFIDEFSQLFNVFKGDMALIGFRPASSRVSAIYTRRESWVPYPKLYPSAEEPVRFLFISRIRVDKGIEKYLSAAEAIHKENPNTEFHIIGGCEGDYE